jgi:hypothetical protein
MRCTGTRRGAPQQESIPFSPPRAAWPAKKQSPFPKNKVVFASPRFAGGGADGANNFVCLSGKFERLNTQSLCFLSLISNKSGIPIA